MHEQQLMNQLNVEDVLGSDKKILFIDVRSPKEYHHSHIAGAVNVPLLNDLERHEVGKLYRMCDRESAIELGTSFVTPRMSCFVSKIKDLCAGYEHIVVYCARGGLRSKAVCLLLQQHNVTAIQLTGGFKEYMHYIHETLECLLQQFLKKPVIALAGKTGSGKTNILQLLKDKGYPVLDLEELCQHRSSVFGGIHLQPRTQKMFLIKLCAALQQLQQTPYVVIEYESQRIGDLFLPKQIVNMLANATLVWVESSIDERVQTIIHEYRPEVISVETVISLLTRLEKFLSKKKVHQLTEYFKQKEFEQFVKMLLLDYYDHKYALPKQAPEFVICSDKINNAVDSLEYFLKQFNSFI